MIPPISQCLFFDTETTGLNPLTAKARGLGYLDGATGEHSYIPLDDWDGDMEVLEHFQALVRTHHLVAHNLHYDLQVLTKLGVDVPTSDRWHCTLSLAKIAAPGLPAFGLKPLAVRMFDESDDDEDRELKLWCKTQKPKVPVEQRFIRAPQSHLSRYCLKDVMLCAKIWTRLKAHLTKPAVLAEYREEMDLLACVTSAEMRGMRLDLKELAAIRAKLDEQIAAHTAECHRLAGGAFNIDSPKQLAQALYGEKLPARYTKNGAPSTAKTALYKIQASNPLAKTVLRLRACEKLLGYCHDYELYRRGDLLSGTFHTLGAKTGRMSCSNPNLQNIPRPDEKGAALMRSVFIPHRGGRVVIAADFSQIELRIGALYAQDSNMLEILGAGGDIHSATAQMVFDSSEKTYRQIAKTLNFLMFYGGTPDKLIESLAAMGKVVTHKEAFGYVAAYHKAFPGIRRLFDRAAREVVLNGGIKDLLGRFYPVPRHQTYKAVNYLIQGTCARILKGAIRRLAPVLVPYEAPMISFIHDEILVDAPAEHCQITQLDGKDAYSAVEGGLLWQIREAMEAQLHPAITVATPVEVSVCPENWARKQKVAQWTAP